MTPPIVYAESSAVFAWLSGEPAGDEVESVMAAANGIVTSDLTIVECERALIRAWALNLISEVERVDRTGLLSRAAESWTRLRVDEETIVRARRPFPVEPVRAFDAVHLASALSARVGAPDLTVLTLDERIRKNAERLGFDILPATDRRGTRHDL
jgi:predicted nucleic acid-binding protein